MAFQLFKLVIMKKSFADKIGLCPQAPGVYVMKNCDDEVLYVGKSINLRKRLQQHAASQKAGWPDRNHRWSYHAATVEWIETGSELYALLLEDQLIKQHWPLANTRQKDFLEYAWLAFSNEAIPRVLVVDARERDHYGHVFGPFRNSFYAQDMADLVQMRFRLRTCAAVSAGGCLQFEIYQCAGPCRHPEAAVRYRRAIDRAITSLRSYDPFFVRYIQNVMQAQVQKQVFEQAAHYHGMLLRYQSFIKRQKFLCWFRQQGVLIREKGRWPNTFQFYQGRLIARNGAAAEDAARPLSEWQIIDRANVVYQWMHSRRSEGEMAIVDERFFQGTPKQPITVLNNTL